MGTYGEPQKVRETVFRTSYQTQLELTNMVNRKANIMLGLTSFLLSGVVAVFLSSATAGDSAYVWAVLLLLVSMMIALVLSVLAARPDLNTKPVSGEDREQGTGNLLFFGNVQHLNLAQYEAAMTHLIHNYDLLYEQMSRDVHSMGTVLQRKYKLLYASYWAFAFGLTASLVILVVQFVIALI
ncbi:MAG: Pycsar system effector family protein [Bacteroidota bacterium]